MNRTRETMRSSRVYLALVAACLIYGTLPLTHREQAQAAVDRGAQMGIDWLADHMGQSPLKTMENGQ